MFEPLPPEMYRGLSESPFPAEAVDILRTAIPDADVDLRPDGFVYLSEIKYRRILNKAFGPGGWGLRLFDMPVDDGVLYYRGGLFVGGRFVAEAIGEQAMNKKMTYATAAESAKSQCLTRCCKDVGIASELWDKAFVSRWLKEYALEVWVENIGTGADKGKKEKRWRKKSDPRIDAWPWRETGLASQPGQDDRRTTGSDSSAAAAPVGSAAGGKARTPGVRIISPAQAKRLRAIATANGWSPDNLTRLLARHKYFAADDVLVADYETICDTLQDRTTLAELREESIREAKARTDRSAGRPDPDDLPDPSVNPDEAEAELNDLPF